MGFPGGSDSKKNLPASQEDLLEEGRAIHSSILAWKIPWTEEPDGLCPRGRKEFGDD